MEEDMIDEIRGEQGKQVTRFPGRYGGQKRVAVRLRRTVAVARCSGVRRAVGVVTR